MKKMVHEKKILYDHSAKQEAKKYTGFQSLIKVDKKLLPNYLNENLEKFKDWID